MHRVACSPAQHASSKSIAPRRLTRNIRSRHIGRPVFATNTAGTQVWTASYTPFSGVRTTTGTPINARFPGQWFQSESGLHQNWMRDYDPTTGRYLQADPFGLVDGASVYGYALQSPMMYTDPRGEQSIIRNGPQSLGVPMFPGETRPGQLGESMLDLLKLLDPRPALEACIYILDPLGYQVYQNTGPYTGETPNDAPQDFTRHGPSGGLRGADGSIWEKDRTRHGGSEWKRWPNEKDWERDRNRESVRPNGTIR